MSELRVQETGVQIKRRNGRKQANRQERQEAEQDQEERAHLSASGLLKQRLERRTENLRASTGSVRIKM